MEVNRIARAAVAAAGLVCMMAFGAAAQSSSGKASAADRQFVTKAAQGGQAEVELGQLAADKGQSQQVKDFGQKMVQDHSKANDQLKQIASQENIPLPSGLSAKDKALKDRLSKLSGAQFDLAYMQSMVQDHKEDIAEFQKEASNGKDQPVKQFAQQTLPTLQEHLHMAQQDKQALMQKSNGTTSASKQQ